MVSIAEQRLSRSLRVVLDNLPINSSIPDSEHYREVLTALKFFIPLILGELYREWTFQGLDDIVPSANRKTGEEEFEIFGVCCFVEDQTLTPLHVHLQVDASNDEISWLECSLGEQGKHGMLRKPYYFLREMTKRLRRLHWNVKQIDWVYKVTFGDRR